MRLALVSWVSLPQTSCVILSSFLPSTVLQKSGVSLFHIPQQCSESGFFSIGEELRDVACKVLKVKIASYEETLSFTPVDIGSVVDIRININKSRSI